MHPPAGCDHRRLQAISLILAASELTLIAATWRLWFAASDFPAVPLLAFLAASSWRRATASALVAMLLLSAMAGGFTFRRPAWRPFARAANCGLPVLALLPVLGNQHTLQPWHWLFLLLTGLPLLLHNPLPPMRSALVSLYVCSALSRVSVPAGDGVGGVLVSELFRLAGGTVPMSPAARAAGVWLLIGAELMVGMLLALPRTRSIGVAFAMLLHAILLLVLGPFGLNHHPAVLLWNLSLLLLAPVLFARQHPAQIPSKIAPPEAAGQPRRGSFPAARAASAIVWMLPLSGLLAGFDNWPSWQVYSSRPERWILLIHEDDAHLLPRPFQQWQREGGLLSDWQPVALDDWSLAATGTPLYPEDRFYLAVIRFVLRQCPAEMRFQVQISEPLRFAWWRRRERSLESAGELDREAAGFSLPARPVP